MNDVVEYMLKYSEGRALLSAVYIEMYQRLRRIHEWGIDRYVIKLENNKILMGEFRRLGYSCSL